jgi:GH35 family endo-1,4-beta-xylanase
VAERLAAPRYNHPLLFDREGKPKPAFDAVIGVVQSSVRD